jgi:glutathione S-transferase
LILEELAVPYKINSFKFGDVKKKPFTDINPNGRNPAIEDPNTDLILWESGAIVQYLIEQYDTEKKLTYTDLKQRNHLNQYLMFQVSGQGPYYGQSGWFSVLHHEKIPSAIERYQNETRRVLGVLEGILEGKQWLVGDKCTYADLVFVPYNNSVEWFLGVAVENRFDGFPNVKAWHERMTSRPSWVRCMEIRAKLVEEQALMPNGMPKGVDNMKEYEAKMKKDEEAAATK